jgi:hypothetical protein
MLNIPHYLLLPGHIPCVNQQELLPCPSSNLYGFNIYEQSPLITKITYYLKFVNDEGKSKNQHIQKRSKRVQLVAHLIGAEDWGQNFAPVFFAPHSRPKSSS